LTLSALAFSAHYEAAEVGVDAIHPDNDPQFSELVGLSTFDMILYDANLAEAYGSASIAYDNAEYSAELKRGELRDRRDQYFVLTALMLLLFALTWLPWRRWGQSLSDGIAQGFASSAGRGEAAIEKIASKLSGEERAIIRREGLDRYSVSVELKNWKELLDKGVVTDEEFEKAKAKILGRM